jgi:ABC-type phosphate transport system auxiliary subunit
MINVKLITNIFKILCFIGLILLLMNSCIVAATPKEELNKLDKPQLFSKILKCDKNLVEMDCDEVKKEYQKLLKENEKLKKNIEFWKKMDMEKMIMLQKWSPIIQELTRYGE